ncbi:TPA: glutamate 5-kinase [bacterium]|nr:glutamate 5-kinase [bacterium]
MKYKKIVIKIGTSVLTDDTGRFNTIFLSAIVDDIAEIRKNGVEIVVVSSGAIGCGMDVLSLNTYPSSIYERQAVSSIGQPLLIDIYRNLFSKHNIKVSQILLTHREIHDKQSHLNILHTFQLLFKLSVIPIVNENDSVGTEELRVGDNDILSSYVAILLNANCLILLTDKDGVYKLNKNNELESVIPVIREVTSEIEKYVKKQKTKATIGGMKTKLSACKIAMEHGIPAIIVNGKKNNVLPRIMEGKREGSLFLPKKK